MAEQGEIIIIIESQEKHLGFDEFDVNFDSSAEEILEAVSPAILEEYGINLQEEQGDWVYTVKKIEDSGNVYIHPKSPAG